MITLDGPIASLLRCVMAVKTSGKGPRGTESILFDTQKVVSVDDKLKNRCRDIAIEITARPLSCDLDMLNISIDVTDIF